LLKPYLRKIFEVAKREDAREESYYSTLEGLLQTFSDSINKKQIHITTLPKKTDADSPFLRYYYSRNTTKFRLLLGAEQYGSIMNC
jgi:hypothetical protein